MASPPVGMAALPLAQRQAALAALQQRIRGCRRCVEQGFLDEAHPIVAGRVGQRVMVVGQAPGAGSRVHHQPWAGPGGRPLQRWLAEAGIPEEEFRERCYFTAITRCYPGRLPNGRGDRVPSPAEQALCRPYLDEELALVGPRVVVLLGKLAIETFLGRARLEDVVGRVVERDGRYFVPLPHPSGVSRWLNHPEHRALVKQALAALRAILACESNGGDDR